MLIIIIDLPVLVKIKAYSITYMTLYGIKIMVHLIYNNHGLIFFSDQDSFWLEMPTKDE